MRFRTFPQDRRFERVVIPAQTQLILSFWDLLLADCIDRCKTEQSVVQDREEIDECGAVMREDLLFLTCGPEAGDDVISRTEQR